MKPLGEFHPLDLFGWAGQAVFTWRVVSQWIASERAKRSVVAASFWAWSIVGTALLLVYAGWRRDPVFLAGPLVSGAIYVRNLWLTRPRAPAGARGRPLWPAVAVGLVVFTGVVIEAIGPDHGLVKFTQGVGWLSLGFAGQALWTGRFVLQWWASERKGVSHLPASFFWTSLLGAALLLAYALSQGDWVYTAAYALNPIPYVRNLVLLSRERAGSAP